MHSAEVDTLFGLKSKPYRKDRLVDLNEAVKKIHWLGYAAVRIDGSTVVLVDPYEITVTKAADLILISHDYAGHNLPKEVAKALKDDSVIVTDAASAKKLTSEVKVMTLGYGSGWVYSKKLKGEVKVVGPGDKLSVKGVEIEIGPDYSAGKGSQPEVGGMLSFIFTLDGVRYYHAGDTDFIPDMKQLDIDIAFLPLSGADITNAVRAAKAIKPRIAIPMHYGRTAGSKDNANKFKKDLDGQIEVVILQYEMIRPVGGG